MDSFANNAQLKAISEEYKPVVLLNMRNSKDSSLINSYLPDTLNVKVSDNGLGNQLFDLCILDDQAFRRNKKQIESLKRNAAPTFCPVLVLSKNKASARASSSILEYADDVIYVPARKQILQSRIEMLLKQRKYSLQLKQKNEELEEKNKQLRIYRQALDATETGVLITDATQDDNPAIYCNKGFEEMTGYSEEEILGKNCRFLQADDREQDEISEIAKSLQNKESGQFVLRNYRKNGSMFWNQLNISPVKNEEGTVTHHIGIQNEVTELIETREQLEQEKEFINSAITSMPGIFYMIDEEQQYVKWNKNLEKELGYSAEEIEQMHMLDFFREDDHDLILSKVQEVIETGSADVEVDILHADGHSIPFYITGTKFVRSGQRYILGTCTNLADLKKAEFKSRQQEQLFDAIINQTDSIIYVKDPEGRYQLVNDAYLSLFNVEEEQVLGKTDYELHPDQFALQIQENDKEVRNKGMAIEFEEKFPLDGQMKYYQTIKYPLQGVPGFENHVCGISTDITGQKEMMDELQERVKEQACLYKIASLSEQELTIEELLEQAVHYLPQGWQYPNITEAAITYDATTYKTADFRETEWTQTATSEQVFDKKLTITIAYTEQQGKSSEGVFLMEERKLIDALTETLAFQIKNILAHHKLQQSKKRWKNLVANAPNYILLVNENAEIDFANPAAAESLGLQDPDDLFGKSIFDVIPLTNPSKAKQRMQRVLDGENLGTATYKMEKEGEQRHILLQSTPVVLEGGQNGLQIIAQDITSRIEYETKLKQTIQEREVLLQEVHHRVKNNLAVVSGLLTIQRFNIDNETLKNILKNCELRIKSMALIHEKLYQTSSLSNINFKNYLEDLISNMRDTMALQENIELSLNCGDIKLNVNQAVPCGLIINELIVNSLKHAFVGLNSGQVIIDVQEHENRVSVEVRDNGVGMTQSEIENIKESMGYTIIDTLTKQLKADFEITSDDGTAVTFSFERQQIKGSSSGIIADEL